MFFIVANTSGIKRDVKPDALQVGFAATSSEIGNVSIQVKVPALSTGLELDDEPAFRPPKGFTKVQVIKANMPVPWAHTSFMPDLQLHFSDHTRCQRRWDPHEMWYTDGSSREVDGRQIIGADVYCPQRGVANRVHCAGMDTTNTINRAELCAAMHCIQCAGFEKEEVLAADNKVFMCLLNRHICSPVRNTTSTRCCYMQRLNSYWKGPDGGCTPESSKGNHMLASRATTGG